MNECRPDWSDNYKAWITALVKHSLASSVGVYDGQWYRQKDVVPTGGSLSVQLANITVFFVMKKAVYSKPQLMRNIATTKGILTMVLALLLAPNGSSSNG